TSGDFPLALAPGAQRTVELAIEQSALLTETQVTALCAGHVHVAGAVRDTLTGAVTAVVSPEVAPTGCPSPLASASARRPAVLPGPVTRVRECSRSRSCGGRARGDAARLRRRRARRLRGENTIGAERRAPRWGALACPLQPTTDAAGHPLGRSNEVSVKEVLSRWRSWRRRRRSPQSCSPPRSSRTRRPRSGRAATKRAACGRRGARRARARTSASRTCSPATTASKTSK